MTDCSNGSRMTFFLRKFSANVCIFVEITQACISEGSCLVMLVFHVSASGWDGFCEIVTFRVAEERKFAVLCKKFHGRRKRDGNFFQ